ncbi:hypothetical protein GSI_11100 [Ganoderma sinense ZZ0214-1]|uniref:Uncharacterized protein n=1 Tax=Ganoderma sinense ZZ0214-1 TaxID=1077348 RepID=A0A2G8RZ87_9APHY|nr:hypothetical protein GSI_11100 [Ganoderma sinense ZZ0214-1]
MHPQQPLQQHDAAMPVDYDAAQQQQQPHPQVHQQMPMSGVATANTGPPQVPPAYAQQAHPGPPVPQAPYGQQYAPPGYYQQPYQGPPAPSSHPAPAPTMGYNAPGPYGPPAAPQIPSIPVPQMAMPPGVPPLLPPRQSLYWRCLNEDLMSMVHGEGCQICAAYGRHVEQALQSDPSFATANASALRDRQIHMHEFFRQHMLSEGGGRLMNDLQRDVNRLREDRDRRREERNNLREERNNLRQEVERLAADNDDLNREAGNAWTTIDHLQHQMEQMAQDDDHRHRRRSRSPHRDSGRPRNQDRHYSPPGRRFDDRHPPSQPHSSRGGSLQPPSSRPRPSSLHHPAPAASEPAMSQQPSTSAAHPAPSANHRSGPTPGTSRRIEGPEAAYDSDKWKDDDLLETEAYDESRGEDRTFNLKAHMINRRARKGQRGPRVELDYGPPVTPLDAVQARLNSLGRAFNPALDPPRIPGGVRGPEHNYWPVPTDRGLADLWSDFVPMTIEQYQELIWSAKDSGSGAQQRVSHLLYQYDRNRALSSLGFLHQLKVRWSGSSSAAPSSSRRNRQRDRQGRSPNRGRANDGRGIPNPSRSDPPEAWMNYWNLTPQARPAYLPRTDQAPFYERNHVRGHLLLRQIIPRFHTEQSSDRAHFVQVVNQLFSVPGLYRFIIEQGAYPQGGQEHFSIYPGPTANVSVFDIAGWLARCGLTEESIELMVPMAIRHRRESDGRRPDSTIPFASWPARLDDVTAVPPFATLTWTDDVADDDTSMDEDHASIHGATAATADPSDPVPMDETPDPAPATAPVPSAALPPASASNTTTAPTPAPSVTMTAPAPSTVATALAQPSTPAASSVPGPSTKPDEAAPPA